MTLQTFFFEAKVVSLIVLMLTFLSIVAYALWPSNKESFDAAASMPLNEE